MRINFSPSRKDVRLTLYVEGDTVKVNGELFDFSPLPEGSTLPCTAIDSNWFVGDVYRKDGDIHISVILPHGIDAPYETRFPQPVTCERGEVPLPPYGGTPV